MDINNIIKNRKILATNRINNISFKPHRKFPPPHFTVLAGMEPYNCPFLRKKHYNGIDIYACQPMPGDTNIIGFIHSLHGAGEINDRSHIIIPCHGIVYRGQHYTLFSRERTTTIDVVRAIRVIPEAFGGGHCSATIYLAQCFAGHPCLISALNADPDIQQHGACYILAGSRKMTNKMNQEVLDTAVSEIRRAIISNDTMDDAQTLFTRLGAFRTNCMTMIGGGLAAPLALHKPHAQYEMGTSGLVGSLDAALSMPGTALRQGSGHQPGIVAAPPKPHPRAEGAREDLKTMAKAAREIDGARTSLSARDIKLQTRRQLKISRRTMLNGSAPETLNQWFGKTYLSDLAGSQPGKSPRRPKGILKTLHLEAIRDPRKDITKSTPWLHDQLRSVGFGAKQYLGFDIVTLAFADYQPDDAIAVIHALGIDGNSSDENGKTVLMYAVQKLDSSAVAALIDDGAALLATSQRAQSALSYALRRHRGSKPSEAGKAQARNIEALVSQATYQAFSRSLEAKPGPAAPQSSLLDGSHFRQKLLDMGLKGKAMTVIANQDQNTIMHLVADLGLLAHVDVLLNTMSGDPWAANSAGQTPFALARQQFSAQQGRDYFHIQNLLLQTLGDALVEETSEGSKFV